MEWKTNEESISQLQWCSHRLLGRTNETCETMMCVLCLFFFCFCFFFSLYAFFRVCARLNTHYNHIYRWIPLFGLKNRARTHTRTHEHMVHNSCMRLSRDTFVVHYVAVCGECGGGVAAVARRTWYTYLYNVNADDIHSIVCIFAHHFWQTSTACGRLHGCMHVSIVNVQYLVRSTLHGLRVSIHLLCYTPTKYGWRPMLETASHTHRQWMRCSVRSAIAVFYVFVQKQY